MTFEKKLVLKMSTHVSNSIAIHARDTNNTLVTNTDCDARQNWPWIVRTVAEANPNMEMRNWRLFGLSDFTRGFKRNLYSLSKFICHFPILF